MRFLVHHLCAIGLLATALLPARAYVAGGSSSTKLRTVVTTDMEQDDLASLIRYLLYSNDLENQGIIYSASRWHWAGDGKGTEFFMPGREYSTPQTSWRWTGNTTIQDKVLKAYAEVYQNLTVHDPTYPTPDELLSIVSIGNIDFEGEMDHDTEGSNVIRSLLLDHDPRTLYLQAWGGCNTIARALKSIEERYSSCSAAKWASLKDAVSRKAVILASGFQDNVYANYISLNWPQVRVEELDAGYQTWGYNCNNKNGTQGNIRGLPDAHVYFTGAWIKANIEIGPYGSLYRSWLDGQMMPGDPEDVFGDLARATNLSSCKPLGPYDFLSEGDNVAFNPLLSTGIQDPANPSLGGWGGRARQNGTSPDLWFMASSEKNEATDTVTDPNYTTDRWMAAAQNDFASRMQWTLAPTYQDSNHAPSVRIINLPKDSVNNYKVAEGSPGSTVALTGAVGDPDSCDTVTTSWWQYLEEGTYPGTVSVTQTQNEGSNRAADVKIPADAQSGQTISIILEGTDDGHFPLTRYDRVFIQVV